VLDSRVLLKVYQYLEYVTQCSVVSDQLTHMYSHVFIHYYCYISLQHTGYVVNFKNTVIILTSNIGAEYLLQVKTQSDVAAAETAVLKAVHSRFRPEFLNRLDEILIFHRYVSMHTYVMLINIRLILLYTALVQYASANMLLLPYAVHFTNC
jgi:AAA domain (Cdc48 subfamily)